MGRLSGPDWFSLCTSQSKNKLPCGTPIYSSPLAFSRCPSLLPPRKPGWPHPQDLSGKALII